MKKIGFWSFGMIALTCAWGAADPIGPLTADQYAAKYDRIQQTMGARGCEVGLKRDPQIAEAICDGYIWFDGREKIKIGEKDIDWFGRQKDHKEFGAQLNRFFMLDQLTDAWNVAPDEKYARRARVLMEDWIDFMERKHQWKFFDPQNDNQLNTALRLNHFRRALATFRRSPAFDAAFCAKLLAVMARQYDALAANTRAGLGNWPIAQATSLLWGGLNLDFLPQSKAWREHGTQVLDGCFKMSFRPDGTFLELAAGYHDWVASQRTQCGKLRELDPALPFQFTREEELKAYEYTSLIRSFGVNDASYQRNFRHVPADPWLRQRISQWLGIKDWEPPKCRIYPDAGLVFGGDGNESLFFDASTYASWHMHYAPLQVCLIADTYNLVADPGVPTYSLAEGDWQKRLYMRDTASHATVNFDRATHAPAAAALLAAAAAPDYTWAVGESNGGHTREKWRNQPSVDGWEIDADFRRMVLHFPKRYVLIFDRTQVLAGGDEVATNYEWPIVPAEKWTLDQAKLRFFTQNTKKGNILVQMVQKPDAELAVICEEGKKNPYRGWIAETWRAFDPAPLVEFSARGGNRRLTAVTLLKNFAPGETAPEIRVTASRPGVLDLQFPDGATESIRWSEDFMRPARLAAAGVQVQAAVLAVRCSRDGKAENIWVGRELRRGPIGQTEFFTGFKNR